MPDDSAVRVKLPDREPSRPLPLEAQEGAGSDSPVDGLTLDVQELGDSADIPTFTHFRAPKQRRYRGLGGPAPQLS